MKYLLFIGGLVSGLKFEAQARYWLIQQSTYAITNSVNWELSHGSFTNQYSIQSHVHKNAMFGAGLLIEFDKSLIETTIGYAHYRVQTDLRIISPKAVHVVSYELPYQRLGIDVNYLVRFSVTHIKKLQLKFHLLAGFNYKSSPDLLFVPISSSLAQNSYIEKNLDGLDLSIRYQLAGRSMGLKFGFSIFSETEKRYPIRISLIWQGNNFFAGQYFRFNEPAISYYKELNTNPSHYSVMLTLPIYRFKCKA